MSTFTKVIGFVWASPLTLLGLLYASAFSVFGLYKPSGMMGDALVWEVVKRNMPEFVFNAWHPWSAQTIGNVIITNVDLHSTRGKLVLRHEQEHVAQAMRLGVFYPIMYALAWFSLWTCKHAHPHYDHPFEVDARRAAGQVVDVIAALKKAMAEGRVKLPAKR